MRRAAARADVCAAVEVAVAKEGAIVDGRPHRAAVEHRQQSIVLARLVACLRIPDDDVAGRPQTRGGVVGSYAMGAG